MSHPLALVSGCNQKTSRDPVLQAGETEVQAAQPQAAEDVSVNDVTALRADLARLEDQLRELRELVSRLAAR
ncbi:MAG: DUF480 domain-containing protein [Burkholderiales bacterium]